MPELPEVETIRQGLEKKIIDLKIKDVEVLNQKTFQGNPKSILGKEVKAVWRRAKILGIDLTSGLTIMFHLKMTGQVIFQGKEKLAGGHPTKDMNQSMPNKSTRVIFTFSDKSKLFFNDQRKFGWIKIVQSSDLKVESFLVKLGPEPLEPGFTWQALKAQMLRRKNQPIKVAILNQELVSGVGNIYASEACFIAKLDPKRKVNTLIDAEFKAFHKGVVQSLSDGIKYGGSSRAHYLNADGEKGHFLDYAFVYDRHGQPCKRCQTEIVKITLGGRGTFLCPKCQ